MSNLENFKIKKPLAKALAEQNIENLTPIQQEAYSPIRAGHDFIGIAQTGTGKTLAYLLPILQDLSYSDQLHPRVLIMVPTRELVTQVVDTLEKFCPKLSLRVVGVYGGTNINTQKQTISEGLDILVATPRRLYDLALTHVLRLNHIKKLVIDEVDIMLDFGYKTQLNNILKYLPTKRQHILFSATMTDFVDNLIDEHLINPVRKTIKLSGTPLENISQEAIPVHNFYTKVNLLNHLLKDKEKYNKVLIFVASRSNADRLFENLKFPGQVSLIHAGKEQNYRLNSVEAFRRGDSRILIATDVIARGMDIEKISNVISFDTPFYPENYIHRIGRTGRAEEKGAAILLYQEKEVEQKLEIEVLMNYQIPETAFPEEVQVESRLTPEEKAKPMDNQVELSEKREVPKTGASFHEKSAKNSKEKPEMKAYERKLKQKYKKSQKRGDKIQNQKKKRK